MSNYQRDMAIDVTALDVEWTEQAELAMKYGRLWTEAQDAASRADENVKYVRSKLILEISKNPEKFGIDKVTDVKIEAAYRVHEDYVDAKDEWLDKVNELNLLSIAKNEISFTRKSALENLVVLHGQQYFAGPKVPRNIKEEIENRQAIRQFNKEKANKRVRINKED